MQFLEASGYWVAVSLIRVKQSFSLLIDTPSVLFYMTLMIFFFNFDQYYLINQLIK